MAYTEIPELEQIIQEAYKSLEDQLSEDKGWINLSISPTAIFTSAQKIDIIKRSRFYSQIDPLATQALRLWTDYTFGSGLNWRSGEEKVTDILNGFWYSSANSPVLSCTGQRRSSHNLLRDGSIYFALFLGAGGQVIIRHIDALEITETISNPDDKEDLRYFKRTWTTPQGSQKIGYYRSWLNMQDKGAQDYMGSLIRATEDAIVYRLKREPNGLPLLLPGLDWIKLYRQFLASRVAIMLALARFAWKTKLATGQAGVTAMKEQVDQTRPDAGGWIIENMGADTQPIRMDTGARNAYEDGNMIKLQICAAFGIPLQYFGDVGAGQYATAKTVELPMIKMFQSYQSIWRDTYQDICNIVLEHNDIPKEKRHIDFDFPDITPENASDVAKNIAALIPVMPELSYSKDVLQKALMSVGISDVANAIEELEKSARESDGRGDVNLKLAKILKEFRGVIKGDGYKQVPKL